MGIIESRLVKMNEVLDMNEYEAAVAAGYIKKVKHPEHDLWIHNYTDKCTWDQAWDSATLNCRGMIVNQHGEIVSRGMPKFFNSDQEQAPKLELDTKVHVTDKMDGSLGILYQLPDKGWAIATRGSFDSDQAIKATKLLNSDKDLLHKLVQQHSEVNHTHLFEIIYPENRIVVDYGRYAGLIHLQVLNNRTGKSTRNFGHSVGYSNAEIADAPKTWGEVLSSPDRSNAEGYVIENLETGELVKVKYDDYKRLHKFITRVTARHVWDCLLNGRNLQDEFQGAPDEFHGWVQEVESDLQGKFDSELANLLSLYETVKKEVVNEFGGDYVRRDYAEVVKGNPSTSKALLFLIEDGKTEARNVAIWKSLKPQASTYRVVNPDSD
jgi:RNA ligase